MNIDYINNKAASRRLAEDITNYWRNKGKPWIKAHVEEQEYTSKNSYDKAPNIIYVVRSNLGFVWDDEHKCYRGVKNESK